MWPELRPEETELIGMWLDLGVNVTGDAIYDRIEWLTANKLTKLHDRADALACLYRDPADGRLWEYERPFPGGPPRLRCVTADEAGATYGDAI